MPRISPACRSRRCIPGREYQLKLAGQELAASVTGVKYRLDIDNLHRVPARTLARGDIGVCTVATHTPLAIDGLAGSRHAGRFTLCDLFTGEIVAAGTVDFALRRGMNIHWQPLTVTKEVRAALKQQRPCVVWLTGLSGAGKSTIANLVEGWLALRGCHTYLLDGDNVRHGLNKDLGFTAADRVENIRRVGEVARLFVDAGVIVICSFISPFRAEREAVRGLLDDSEFIEIHVTAPLEVCERRDPKGPLCQEPRGTVAELHRHRFTLRGAGKSRPCSRHDVSPGCGARPARRRIVAIPRCGAAGSGRRAPRWQPITCANGADASISP